MAREIGYKRCRNCACVYTDDLDKCPKCGEVPSIDESFDNEPVFNIND